MRTCSGTVGAAWTSIAASTANALKHAIRFMGAPWMKCCGVTATRGVSLFLIYCRRLGRLYGPRIDIDYLRPLSFGRKARRAHQLGYGRDRRGIGARETAGVALGEEQWRSAEFVGILPDLRIEA